MRRLSHGNINEEYIIKGVDTSDEELRGFLLTLGCFQGESVTIISKLSQNLIVTIKDARYSLDTDLANVILV